MTGFLEPEELSSMIGGGGCTGKIVKSVLPGIQEDALSRRSTDSLSTLASDTLTMRSLEADFFEDIRASIQKSTPMSTRPTSKGNDIIGATDSPTTQCMHDLFSDIGMLFIYFKFQFICWCVIHFGGYKRSL